MAHSLRICFLYCIDLQQQMYNCDKHHPNQWCLYDTPQGTQLGNVWAAPFQSCSFWLADFIHTSSGQVVLAGDPLQLGPVVLSLLASSMGLAESFLSRLLQHFPYQRDPQGFPHTDGYNPRLITRLSLNYRSVPEILSLPNSLFYNSYLQPQVHEAQIFCC
jgi:hypothetical protein